MTPFLKLNLLSNPLKDLDSPEIECIVSRGHRILSPGDVLTEELLEKFKEMNLTPKFVILFSGNNKEAGLGFRMIHTDLTIDDNENWIRSLFGINWEITGSWNKFVWWNMDQFPEVWPESHLPKSMLNGIHYCERRYLGVPLGATIIDETVIDGPTLVRTDIPHSTSYRNQNQIRKGISVRFYEDEFKDWNDVVEKLKPYELL
jgi:hypothetical protein